MNKVAIAFSSKDRIELSRQTIVPLLQPDKFDLFWIDGSTDPNAVQLALDFGNEKNTRWNVRGGADAAIVYALTEMLNGPYTHIGLVENDVLLSQDWFQRTIDLFDLGASAGLEVGAVSARCFEDRVLIQRNGYAVMHNLGAGHVIYSRRAAELILLNYRTGWWSDNRRVFSQLSGIDIGGYACFRGNEQATTADWHFDAVLADCGLASLALIPALATMIGQVPSLEEQGLKLATGPVEERRDDTAFNIFAMRTMAVRDGVLTLDAVPWAQHANGTYTYFPHQFESLGAFDLGGWRLKWSQGYGPFSYVADEDATLSLPVFGPCSFVMSGGEKGATVTIRDLKSGFEISPQLEPEGNLERVPTLNVPGAFNYRQIEIRASKGARLFSMQTSERQPTYPNVGFDHSTLPSVME